MIYLHNRIVWVDNKGWDILMFVMEGGNGRGALLGGLGGSRGRVMCHALGIFVNGVDIGKVGAR